MDTLDHICIGILNHLFFWPEQYRRTRELSIAFLFDENPDVASAGLGGAAVGGARSVPDHAARSNSERAAPSARVGNRFSAPQIVWNKSNRCAGERGGARVGRPRWVRILMITGGSSMSVLSVSKGPPGKAKNNLPPWCGGRGEPQVQQTNRQGHFTATAFKKSRSGPRSGRSFPAFEICTSIQTPSR